MKPRTPTPSPSAMAHEAPETRSLLLRPAEAARLLAISPRKLWEITNTGEIPFVRIGRCLRYAPAALAAWVTARQVRP